ncbi:DUF3795 domain-containing protein [candidate division WOR-3 bacterium]|nr:DUF3795 domain-containing protein [candidate division WOR-3 bacterium]
MIGCCGLVCSECPAYIATIEDDGDKREETSKLWSKIYNSEIKPEDINCLGCQQKNGVLFSYCSICKIRSCCFDKKIENCAHCSLFSCEKTEEFFSYAPEAKKNLDEIKRKL